MVSERIKLLISKIQEFMAGQPIQRAWLFGSCSRGEETSNSDVDILVDYDNSKGLVSLMKMGGILMDLSDLLGRRVDLVENRGLKDFARASVEKDKILIYERPN
ncbi:MAG: nucleotidyltransferase domain-containing protein [Muribaculaceae bacterium]|nr:nucleotidyltransferase domain-containing protein [Muribaculaceae bacterium]